MTAATGGINEQTILTQSVSADPIGLWTLRHSGKSVKVATECVSGLSVAEKNELLFSTAGVNFNDVPNWQKRGVGLYWEDYEKEAINPKTGNQVTATRRRINRDHDLPMRDAYGAFVRTLISREDPKD